jgi:hypothetical protein
MGSAGGGFDVRRSIFSVFRPGGVSYERFRVHASEHASSPLEVIILYASPSLTCLLKLANFMLTFCILVPIIGLLFKYQFMYHKGGAYVTGEI